MPNQQMWILAGGAEDEEREARPSSRRSTQHGSTESARDWNGATKRSREAPEGDCTRNRCQDDATRSPWREIDRRRQYVGRVQWIDQGDGRIDWRDERRGDKQRRDLRTRRASPEGNECCCERERSERLCGIRIIWDGFAGGATRPSTPAECAQYCSLSSLRGGTSSSTPPPIRRDASRGEARPHGSNGPLARAWRSRMRRPGSVSEELLSQR